jgi:hypothetical protein
LKLLLLVVMFLKPHLHLMTAYSIRWYVQQHEGVLFPAQEAGLRSWTGAALKRGGEMPASAPSEEASARHGGQIEALSVHDRTHQVALVHHISSEDQIISIMPLPELPEL